MADVQCQMAIRGQLRGLGEAVAIAQTAGVRAGVGSHKQAVRRRIEASGLGPKLAKAWRGVVRGASGRDLTVKGVDVDPTGATFSKAVVKRGGPVIDLLGDVFDRGVRVQATGGPYLEIPTKQHPQGRKAPSSETFPDGTFRRVPVGGKRRGRPAANRVAYVLIHRGTNAVWYLWMKTVRVRSRGLRIAASYRTATRRVQTVHDRTFARELVKRGVAP